MIYVLGRQKVYVALTPSTLVQGKDEVVSYIGIMDGSSILFGEAKWEKKTNETQVMEKLSVHAENFPKIGKRKIVLAAWCKHPVNPPGDIHIYNADTVLNVVKN